MIVGVHQPNFLPYVGFFNKMALVDRFVLYDCAQFSRNELHNRNQIKTPVGAQWLTVPVRHGNIREIRHTELDGSRPWAQRHLRTIHANYSRSPFFASYSDDVGRIYARKWERLSELNEAFIVFIARALGIDTSIAKASELRIGGRSASERLAEITVKSGGTAYLSGPGGPDYLDKTAFTEVQLLLQRFRHPVYRQQWGPFVSGMCALDLLFNEGERAGEIVRGSGSVEPWPG